MGKTTLVSVEKQQQVLTLFAEGNNQKYIEKKSGVSRRTIGRIIDRGVIKRENEYHNKSGRPRKLNSKKEKKIKQIVKKDNRKTLLKIVAEIEENVSKSTMSRTLKRLNLKKRKMKTKPLLTQKHKDNRITFAREYASVNYNWSKWIFSDEKKFNLDGPDGYRYYWADKSLNENVEIYSKDHNCRKNVMVWGAISKQGVSHLIEVKPKTKAPDYIKILQEGLIPIYDDGDIFQQDGAKCHTAKLTKKFLEDNSIICPTWPSKSPDLSPIENIWGWITNKVYFGNPPYQDIKSLKSAIFQAWDEIPDDLIDSLIESMPGRMLEVIKNNGNPINY